MIHELQSTFEKTEAIPESVEPVGTELPTLLGALPNHKCSLSICHNEHKDNFMPVAEWAEIGNLKFASEADKKKAIESDEIWTIYWYPETPMHFDTLSASTLSSLLDAVKDADI